MACTISGSKDENLKLKKRRKERREGVSGWSSMSRTGHVTSLKVRNLVPFNLYSLFSFCKVKDTRQGAIALIALRLY